jgi:Protein of unknown function (DUF4238)
VFHTEGKTDVAGDRQHYLPQFLQRGFADADDFVWFFRKNQPGRRVSTRNVGVERTFYTKQNDTHVDDSITTAEAEFSRSIRALRTSRSGSIDAGSLPKLFAHLEVRTRHLRQSFLQASESLYRKTVPILSDKEQLGRLLGDHIARNPEKLSQMVQDELQQRGLSTSGSGALFKEMTDRLPEFLHELGPELERATTNILSALPETLRTSIKDAHNRALGKTIAPEIRVQNYEKLNFRTADVPEGNMILGDCGPIFHVVGSKPFKTITGKSDIILAAILPIAHTRLLIGANPDYQVALPEIRTAIAGCSLEFFIASENSDKNTELAKLISFDAAPLSDTEIEDIVEEGSS